MITVYAQKNKTTKLGRVGENRRIRVAFSIKEWLDEYPGATYNLVNRTPGTNDSYPIATTDCDGEYLYWTVLSSDLKNQGVGECELIIMDGEEIAKSIIYKTSVLESLDGSGDIPKPWESFQEEFLRIKDETVAAAEAVENLGVESETLDTSQATVTKTVDPVTGAVTLTFGIPKGDKGNPGTSIVSITKTSSSENVDTYTITMNDGTTSTFEVTNGIDGKDGVDGINGTDGVDGNDGVTFTPFVSNEGVISWRNDGGLPNPASVNIKGPKGDPGSADLSEYVKKTDYASSSNSGVVKIDSSKGVYINNSNSLAINAAAQATIKSGSDSSRPIVPIYQHIAAFYGLAKAAGVDMKNNYNPVGEYTEEAKAAIREMIGVPSKVSEIQNDSDFITRSELQIILSRL